MISRQRRKHLARFATTGIGATVLHIVIASYLIEQHLFKPNAANGCAFTVATLFSYLVNTYWSFSAAANIKNAYRFWITSVVGFIIAVSLTTIADVLSMHYLIGIAMVVVVVPLVNFVIHSNWTFKD